MPTASGHTTAIRATKVVGTPLLSANGEPLGKIEDLVLDKTSDRIMFAAARIGGVVTTADSYTALPWQILDFDENAGGYVVSCTQEQLASAPRCGKLSDLTEQDGARHSASALRHFGLGPNA